MRSLLQIGGLLLLCSAAGMAADQKNPAKSEAPRPATSRPGGPRAVFPKNGGAPRQPKMGPPLSNPASPAARLYRATPEERDRALEKLPPRMQEQIRKQLAAFDALPKAQQEMRIRATEHFASLPPERQAEIRGEMQTLAKMPPAQRGPIAVALRRLQMMPEADRQRVLNSDDFKTRFSPEEQKIIADLSEGMLPPM